MYEVPCWQVSRSIIADCEVFGLWDRLGDSTLEELVERPSLESLGVEFWRSQVLDQLIPFERPLFVCLSAATWRFSGISRCWNPGRSAWAGGARWMRESGNAVIAFFPALDETSLSPMSSILETRAGLFQSLGYYDEWLPEVVFIPNGNAEARDRKLLRQWRATRELWCDPSRLIPEAAMGVFVFFNGWLYIAVQPSSASAVASGIETLGSRWGVRCTRGCPEYAWFC